MNKKKENKIPIFNPNLDKWGKIIFFVFGIGLLIFVGFYSINEPDGLISKVGFSEKIRDTLMYCILGGAGVLGSLSLLLIFNIQNKLIQIIIILILGMLISSAMYDSNIRAILLGLLIDVIIFLIIVAVLELYSTVMTLFIFGILSIFLIGTIVIHIPYYDDRPDAGVYLIITLFLIIYQILGVRLNKFFIGKIMGQIERAEGFESELFKLHMLIISAAIFVLINVTGLLYEKSGFNYSNIVNNCFITAITISQINWNKAFIKTSLKRKIIDFTSSSEKDENLEE
ncbi:hypothetical protein J2Z32_004336 [Paenibacillus turicensis]|uniref:DUF418 domain-containing protein n=1 Tax=Paenibacillus turicensis TaxID=160487 RepID=A0ABS4FYK2_9BACL|nr:hypothetical protein [Paenibacillus turicensis]MBP1907656.1 hypothetical protein [Paenibacillus turicensis]